MGSSKAQGKIQVTEHYMSMHVGVCAFRRGTELLRFYVGDKEAWSGNYKRTTQFVVNEPELFGGLKKEGGVRGLVSWLPGSPNQVLPENIASRISGDLSEIPGFRGLASLFFSGAGRRGNSDIPRPDGTVTPVLQDGYFDGDPNEIVDSTGGFMWTANNPYLKPLKVRVRCVPEGLNPAIAMLDLPNDSQDRSQKAANPAHIIFECLTNRSWGMGASMSGVDIGSFEKVAQALYEEDFGLGMIWTRQTEIENFINEVLDHIHAKMFMHPLTGKHTIKLLRDDYDIGELDELNPDNTKLMNFKRKTWGETANEVIVSYTDAETEEERTVTAQDPGAIAMQGGQVISSSKNYYGVRTEELASRIAQRDVAMMSFPIATCEAEVSRENWKLVPGDVIKVNWPEHGVSQIVFRVQDVNYGDATNRTIRIQLHEDIFSVDKSEYLIGGASKWVNPNAQPAELTRFSVQTAPAFLTARSLGVNSPSDLSYPEVMTAIAAGKNNISESVYEVLTKGAGTSGDEIVISLGERPHSGTGTLVDALIQEAQSVVPISLSYVGPKPRVNDFVLISDLSEQQSEIGLVVSTTATQMTIWRGVLDTSPKSWAQGTRFWLLDDGVRSVDESMRSDGEEISYKFLNRTPNGVFSEALAPWIEYTATDRPYRPNRPANVFVNGTGFGSHDATGEAVFNVSWSRRNRTVEVLQVFAWWEGDMVPEADQTTTVRLLRTNETLITEFTGIEGTSQEVLLADFDSETEAYVEVSSERDGFESLQGHRILLTNLGS